MTGGGASSRVFRLLALIAAMATALGSDPVSLRAAAPEVVAASAIVIDADTGAVLYEKRADEPWAPASLTKIVTALVALETAPLDQMLTVEPSDLVGEASMGLAAGDKLTLETALYGLLLPSGNDAAMTIARNLGALPGDSPQESVDRFMRRTNLMLKRMGLRDTRLLNPHGLDQPGHRTTARELALVTREALQNPTFRRIISSPVYEDGRYSLQQSNRLLGSYPGLIGGKTGITDGCGYCLMEAAELDGHTVIAIVLGSSVEAWYEDARVLLDYGFAQLASGNTAQEPFATAIPRAALPAGSASASATRSSEFPQRVAATTPGPSALAGPSENRTTGSLAVDRAAPDVAVVRPASAAQGSSRETWRWPLSALLAMGAALAVVTTYPAVLGLGSLLWQRRRAARRRAIDARLFASVAAPAARPAARHTRRQRGRPSTMPTRPESRQPSRKPAAGSPRRSWSVPAASVGHRETERPRVVRFNAAEAVTSRAIKLARRGDYHAAESEFLHALKIDPSYDFTRCPGFWSMPPAGYVLAARAYLALRRGRDARTLLTVVRLSFGSTPLLEDELQRASDIDEAPALPLGLQLSQSLPRRG